MSIRRSVLWLVMACFFAMVGRSRDSFAQSYSWRNDVSPVLEGSWVKTGQKCEDSGSLLMIFSTGGYRWRKAATEWGYARGKYSWQPGSPTISFKLQRFEPQDSPDFLFTVVGPEMRKYTYASGQLTKFSRCR